MHKLTKALLVAALSTVACPKPAAAHFKLTSPPSWLKEDANGGPQKGGPCGPGGYDNVNPPPTSGIVTDFHAGETIELTWVDTVAHPGYFRVALAQNRADFKNPTIVQDASCNFDESMVPKTASGNVLVDGAQFRSRNGFAAPAGTMFKQMVTLPNQPCDKCTLQVMQVMENDLKALSQCYYFHCADIRILPAGTGGNTGGATGAGGAGMPNGGGGTTMVSMGGSGMVIMPSSGGTTGGAGMFGLGGVVSAGAGAPGVMAGGTTGAPPASGNGGAAMPVGPTGAAGEAELGGAAGMTAGAAPNGNDGSSCAVGLHGKTGRSTLGVLGLLSTLAVLRRRQVVRGRRK